MQKYHVWTHESSGDTVVRTLTYGIPEDVFDHIELVQPTTMFARMKSHKTTFRFSPIQPAVEGTPATTSSSGSPLLGPGGSQVDASCNDVITLSCLQQLYNSVGVKGSNKDGNQIAVTAYLGQFANLADLKLFFEDQNPAAADSSFKLVSINGGQNPQNATLAGVEANLDTQFAFGLTFPTPGMSAYLVFKGFFLNKSSPRSNIFLDRRNAALHPGLENRNRYKRTLHHG